MSKLKYTIVQKGGAFHMSGETPIHFILHCINVRSSEETKNSTFVYTKNSVNQDYNWYRYTT